MTRSTEEKSNNNIFQAIEKFLILIAAGYTVSSFCMYEYIDPKIMDNFIDRYDNYYDES